MNRARSTPQSAFRKRHRSTNSRKCAFYARSHLATRKAKMILANAEGAIEENLVHFTLTSCENAFPCNLLSAKGPKSRSLLTTYQKHPPACPFPLRGWKSNTRKSNGKKLQSTQSSCCTRYHSPSERCGELEQSCQVGGQEVNRFRRGGGPVKLATTAYPFSRSLDIFLKQHKPNRQLSRIVQKAERQHNLLRRFGL